MRPCNECKGQIDGEVHFLIECNKYDKLITDLFDSLLACHPFILRHDNMETLIELMTIVMTSMCLLLWVISDIWHSNSNNKFPVYVNDT